MKLFSRPRQVDDYRSSGRLQSIAPPTAKALSLQGLKEGVPEQYSLWVRSAVLVCICAYSIMALVQELANVPSTFVVRQEYIALVILFAGLYLERRGKPMYGAYLVLGAVSTETCLSFYHSPAGMQSAALPALPVLVMGAGLFLGPRAAYVMALGISLTVPGLVWVSGTQGFGSGLSGSASVYVAGLICSVLGAAFVLHVFLRSFGHILARASANERRAADLLEAAPDGLLVIAPDGRVEAANDHASRLLGRERSGLLGLVPQDLGLEPGDGGGEGLDMSRLREGGGQSLRASATGLDLEVRARRVASGDERASWLLLVRDVTAQLEAERREHELASQLQHSQKLEAVGQLAGGVAHDFNNLLTVVAGYADFIEDLPEEGADEIAEELRGTYQRGVVLTRQLLAFARREVISPVPLDVAASVRGLEKLIRRLVGEQIRVEIRADAVAPIVSDAGQLEQVIINLAANARDAMPQGGSLRIRVSSMGEHVVLEVADTGVGIEPELQARIFDPFFTTKPRGKGTGLGLATVHGIISQAEGEISVESTPGEGARFFVQWPKTDRALPGRSKISQSARQRRGSGLILLAEDDAHARKLIVRMLEEAGFEVLVAQDGAEALSLAVNSTRTPDLLLTDVVMPGMSGVELIERVLRLHPRLKFLLMSGYTDQQLTPAQFDPSEDLIQKPFGREELLERILRKLPVEARKFA